ncbi:MAG: hypothetical protein H7A47_15500 [Verrucomicrobiales bacterium]|nr:hypothetical protein [Verrucomicrobiales bacterium]
MVASVQIGSWLRQGFGAPRLVVTGFGKHPAWAEHQKGLGASSPMLAELRKRLYLDGISASLPTWEGLPAEQQQPFDHWVVWIRDRNIILARLLASMDQAGRSAFPFVVAAEISGVNLPVVLRRLAPHLDQFARQCAGLSSPADVRAAFKRAQSSLESLADQEIRAGEDLNLRPEERAVFVDLQAWVADGDDQPLAQLLSRAQRQRFWEGGVVARFPCPADRLASSILLWEEFVKPRIRERQPRLYLVPAKADWLDVVVGNVEGNHFHGLQVNRVGLRTYAERGANEKPADSLQDEARAALAAWRQGPGDGKPQTKSEPDSRANTLPAKDVSAPVTPKPAGAGKPPGRVRRHWRVPVGLGAGLLVVLGLWMLLKPVPTDHLLARARQHLDAKRYHQALGDFQRILSREPDNGEAAAQVKRLSSSPALRGPSVLKVEAGKEQKIAVQCVDDLGREVQVAIGADQLTGGDRVVKRGDGWIYIAAPGEGRTNRITARLDNGQASTNVALRVVVEADEVSALLAAAEAAFKEGRFADARTQYGKVLGLDASNPRAIERMARLLSVPRFAGPGVLVVGAGKEQRIDVQCVDDLGREVQVAIGADQLTGGDRVVKRGDEWIYIAAPGEGRTNRITARLDNGQASTNVALRVVVEADEVSALLAAAEAAFKEGRFADARTQYGKVLGLDASNPRAIERMARLLSVPRFAGPGVLVVGAGKEQRIDVQCVDDLGREVQVAIGADQLTGGDRVVKRGDGWIYIAAPGEGRTNRITARLDNGQASTNVALRVVVEADEVSALLAAAEAAFKEGRFADARTQYGKVLGLDASNPRAIERMARLLSVPRFAGPGVLVVGAGKEQRIDVQCVDDLGREVQVAIGADQLTGGDRVVKRGDGWIYIAAPGEGRTNRITARLDNGQASTNVALRVVVEADEVSALLATAEAALKEGQFADARTQYGKVLGLDASNPRAIERMAQLLSAPRFAGPGVLAVEAGKEQKIDVQCVDDLGREVQVAIGADQLTGGDRVVKRGDGWIYIAAPGEGRTNRITARLDNGQASTNVALRVVVGADRSGQVTRSQMPEDPVEIAREFPIPPVQIPPYRSQDFVWMPEEGPSYGAKWPGKPRTGLWVCRYETSRADYREIMGSLPGEEEDGAADMPAANLPQEKVERFLAKLNQDHKSELPSGWVYRLPTNREWRRFSGAGRIPPDAVLGAGGPRPVRLGTTNRWGVVHAVGNVAELTASAPSGKVLQVGLGFSDAKKPGIGTLWGQMLDGTDFSGPAPDVGFRIVLGKKLLPRE